MHAVSFSNRFHVGVDGRTAYFRVHHKNFFGNVFEVGDQVMDKPKMRLRGTRGDGTGSLKARWVEAT